MRQSWKPVQANIPLSGKVCRKMERKNVPEDAGCHTTSDQGIPTEVFGCFGNKDTGLAANRPVFRRTLSDRQHGFCSWT